MACRDRQESFPEVCSAALCLTRIRGVTLLMTQFMESGDALGHIFVPSFQNSCLHEKVNIPEAPLRPRDVRPGMEPPSWWTCTFPNTDIFSWKGTASWQPCSWPRGSQSPTKRIEATSLRGSSWQMNPDSMER